MMGKHIRKLWSALARTQAGQQSLTKYMQMTQHAGWAVHQNMIVLLKGLIIEDLLSKSFTNLSPQDKDTRQRAYAGVIEVLDFLNDPHAKAQNQMDITNHNRKMGATVSGATKGDAT